MKQEAPTFTGGGSSFMFRCLAFTHTNGNFHNKKGVAHGQLFQYDRTYIFKVSVIILHNKIR